MAPSYSPTPWQGTAWDVRSGGADYIAASSRAGDRLDTGLVVGIIFAAIGFIALTVFASIYIWKMQKEAETEPPAGTTELQVQSPQALIGTGQPAGVLHDSVPAALAYHDDDPHMRNGRARAGHHAPPNTAAHTAVHTDHSRRHSDLHSDLSHPSGLHDHSTPGNTPGEAHLDGGPNSTIKFQKPF